LNGEAAVLAVDAGMAGDRVSSLLTIPEDECAIVIARAGETVDDLDLLAYAEDGSVVGIDEAPDKTPALLICPPHPRRVWVAARIAAGHGLVALGAGRVQPNEAQRAAKVYGIRHGNGPATNQPEVIRGLEERLAEHRRELGGAWQDIRRVPVPLDPRVPTRVSARVEAGRCLDALVVPTDEVGHVNVTAADANGAIVGRAQSSGRDRYLVLCATSDTPLTLELRPHSGRGMGMLMFSRSRPGSETDLEIEPTRIDAFPATDLGEEIARAQRELRRAGYANGRALLSGTLEVGRRTSHEITLPEGCSRLDLLGGAPLRGIRAWVWSPGGDLISTTSAGGRGVLFVCGRGGTARLDAEATLRPGPFTVLLNPEPGAPAPLAEAPLAAGRLLANVVERGVLRRGAEIGLVRKYTLSETAFETIELTVPFGRCMDVALALDRGAIGAEIRLVAASSGKEIASGRGPHATSARVCALDAESAQTNLKTRAELRVASGSGVALVSTRMLSPAR